MLYTDHGDRYNESAVYLSKIDVYKPERNRNVIFYTVQFNIESKSSSAPIRDTESTVMYNHKVFVVSISKSNGIIFVPLCYDHRKICGVIFYVLMV